MRLIQNLSINQNNDTERENYGQLWRECRAQSKLIRLRGGTYIKHKYFWAENGPSLLILWPNLIERKYLFLNN